MNLKWIFLVLLLSGCQDVLASKGEVVLLGDDARILLSDATGLETPRKDASASEVATAAASAKHAVLVIDAERGPLPITREHILIARQARVPSLSMLVVNTTALDGLPDKASLIDDEVAEVRQLFDKYEIKGSAVPLFFDDDGLNAILRESVALPGRAPESVPSSVGKEVSGFIYLLSTLESPGVEGLRQGDAVTIWIGGQTSRAIVASEAAIEPGGVDEIRIETEVPVGSSPGQRFLFESGGKLVAAGVVTE